MPYALCLALCACGFAPMESAPQTNDIFIGTISGTNGIDLRNALCAKFETDNVPGAKYTLTVNLAAPGMIMKGIQRTGDSTWQEVRIAATYTLKDDAGKELLRGSDTASESYAFVRDLVASNASYNNAVQSTISILADKISIKVNAKLSPVASRQSPVEN